MFDREGEIGVALLPITVILSIPAIRNLYVGSPPLGIYLGAWRDSTAHRGLTALFRRGRVLPTDANSRVVHHGSVV